MSVIQGGEHEDPRRGGHDPLAPQVLTRHQVTGRLRIGHTASFDDQSAPIIIREADDVYPGSTYAEGRCRACIARPCLARGEDESILILQHQPDCPDLARLLALAGARP
jgi:hypothetical protein